MFYDLPSKGAAKPELAADVHTWWQEAFAKEHPHVPLFDPSASLMDRITWARLHELEIGTVYARFSSKQQHSTADQVRMCVEHAARLGIYCPPELICVDEAQRGYRERRPGLQRLLKILENRWAHVLLVFKMSRLHRQAYRGYQFVQQEVVERSLRAISVTQGIDTANTEAWRLLLQVHGIVDDMQVQATADHVRAGLKGLFHQGYTVGALPLGYRRKEVPDAPRTNRGLVRTVPEIDPKVAALIREHFQLIRNGLPIQQGWKKWVERGGPADPRSPSGQMSYHAYRRMLSRKAYIGVWEFCRTRSVYLTKKDYAIRVPQDESEVVVLQREDLRIVDDATFYAVQKRLASLKQGPQGPRKRTPGFEQMVVELFWCACCGVRFYRSCGTKHAMKCKNGILCPCRATIRTADAVAAVCDQLGQLIQRDAQLIEQVICRAKQLDAQGDQQLREQIEHQQRRIAALSRKIDDLTELAGQGTDEDRRQLKAKIQAAQAERASAREELARLQQALAQTSSTIRPEDVRRILTDIRTLLENAAAGKLGADAVPKAVAVFRALVGERIWVEAKPRPARKRMNVWGRFRPQLIRAVREQLGQPHADGAESDEEVRVQLRQPPLCDRLAPRVHQLIDVEGHSYRSAAKVLQSEGYNINSGVVWQIYGRYYEMIGQPRPKRPYNNGRKRDSA